MFAYVENSYLNIMVYFLIIKNMFKQQNNPIAKSNLRRVAVYQFARFLKLCPGQSSFFFF